jgi:hypothetical protein
VARIHVFFVVKAMELCTAIQEGLEATDWILRGNINDWGRTF